MEVVMIMDIMIFNFLKSLIKLEVLENLCLKTMGDSNLIDLLLQQASLPTLLFLIKCQTQE